jgi:hypothetical protein
MSAFDAGRSIQQTVRRTGVQMRGDNINVGLEAPGVIAAPPISSGAIAAQQLADTFANFVNTGTAVGRVANSIEANNIRAMQERQRLQQEQARQAAEDARLLENSKNTAIGSGAQLVTQYAPATESRIASNEITNRGVPIGADEIPSMAESLANADADKLKLDGYARQGFVEGAIPRYASALEKNRNDNVRSATGLVVSQYTNAVPILVAQGKDINEETERTHQATGVPVYVLKGGLVSVMKEAAANNNPDVANALFGVLKDEFPTDVESAQVRLKHEGEMEVKRFRADQQQEVNDIVARVGMGQMSIDNGRQTIKEKRQAGWIDDQTVFMANQALVGFGTEEAKQRLKERSQLEHQYLMASLMSSTLNGTLPKHKAIEIATENGGSRTYEPKELQEMGLNEFVKQRLASLPPQATELEKLAANRDIMRVAHKNGMVYKPFTESLLQTHSMITTDSFTGRKENEQSDKQIMRQVTMFSEMRANAPAMLNDLTDSVRSDYEAIMIGVERLGSKEEAVRAMAANKKRNYQMTAADTKAIEDATKSIVDRIGIFNYDNKDTIASIVRSHYMFARSSFQNADDTANSVIRHIDNNKLRINDQLVYYPKPGGVPSIFAAQVEDYIAEISLGWGKENAFQGSRMERGDVRVFFNNEQKTWEIRRTGTNDYVMAKEKPLVFADEEFVQMMSARQVDGIINSARWMGNVNMGVGIDGRDIPVVPMLPGRRTAQ